MANGPPKRRRIPLPGDRATGFRNPVEKPRATPSAPDAPAPKNWEDDLVILDRVVTPESYRESLSPEEQKRYDKEQMELRQRQERERRKNFDDRAIDPETYMKMFGRKGRTTTAKSGGTMKSYAKGGSVSSASKRADGCVTKGKTRGKFV